MQWTLFRVTLTRVFLESVRVQTWPGIGIGVRLNSGSNIIRKSVNLPRDMTQSWVNLTPFFVKSAESWPISGSWLTRNGVWSHAMDSFPSHADPGVLRVNAGSNVTRDRSIGVRLNSGSTIIRKSVNLPRNMTQSWVNLTSLFVKSAENSPNSGSILTRNWVLSRWTLS